MFRRAYWTLWAVVLFGVLVRAAAMLRGPTAFDDPDNYLQLARSLWDGNGYTWHGRPTAYRPPLYPLLLAPAVAMARNHVNWGIGVLHLGLGAGTILLTARAAKGWGLSSARSTLAAFVTACDPVLVWQSRGVMTETPAAFFLAAFLAAIALPGSAGPILGGLAMGLAAHCRPSMLAGGVLTAVAALLAQPGDFRHRAFRATLLTAMIMVVLSPWMIRNWVAFGEPVWTTTHGGYTLALANNPVYYDDVLHSTVGRVWNGENQRQWWISVNRATARMSEPQADRYLRRAVWQTIVERPTDFATASLARLVRFWSVAPAASVYPGVVRYATMAWTIPLWAAAIFGLARRELWRWPRIAAPMSALGLTLVHTLFWTDLRMRAPVVPALALIAAATALPRWIMPRITPQAHSGHDDVDV